MHASSKDNPSRMAAPRVGTGYSVSGGHKTTGKAGNQIGQGTPHSVSKCSLFLVLKKDGSQRPVINLKPLNHYMQKQMFKMEGAKVIARKTARWSPLT